MDYELYRRASTAHGNFRNLTVSPTDRERRKEKEKMANYIKNSMNLKGEVTAKAIDTDRYIIYLDGKYFGIYDTRRKTFVD